MKKTYYIPKKGRSQLKTNTFGTISQKGLYACTNILHIEGSNQHIFRKYLYTVKLGGRSQCRLIKRLELQDI